MPPRTQPFRPEAPVVAEIAAGAVVLQAADRTALLLHELEEDRWCLPKGHVDPGESLTTAALREIREETGFERVRLTVELLEVHYRFYQPKQQHNVHKTVVYFLGETDEREARLEPFFDRSAWVPLLDADARVAYELDRQVLRAARDRVAVGPSKK